MPINGIYKTKEYEDAFNFICIMAFGHAEYMKELENEAFAIARGKMAAGREVENNVEMASGTPSYGL